VKVLASRVVQIGMKELRLLRLGVCRMNPKELFGREAARVVAWRTEREVSVSVSKRRFIKLWNAAC
jgi:hypothetical protein